MSRLLFISDRFPPDIGGVSRSSQRLVGELAEMGITVDVLTWTQSLEAGEVASDRYSDNHDIQVYRVGRHRHWDTTMPHTLNAIAWLQEQKPYDAVWGHYLFPGGFLAVWLGQNQQIPCTVSVRGNDLERTLFPPGDFSRLQWTLKNADVITAVSEDLRKKIEKIVSDQEIFLLKNAVDEKIFTPASDRTGINSLRTQLNIAENEVVLGFSGELREKKGSKFLLNALHYLRQYRPACLFIIGDIRPDEETNIQKFASQYPDAGNRIIITGHLEDPATIAKYLQICDVYLQPSLWEGMPNALLEAMACGCCCIASDAGGIPEIIEHGKDGFLLPRWQLHHLATAIWEFLELDAATRQAISQAACDRIRQEFSIAAEKQRLQEVLQRLGIA
jgi:glycosyltransferase involved in cell wall biosynthesis